VLEHLDREHAPAFLRECRRVLKPGGVLRVVVPDLEQMARVYLDILDRPRTTEKRTALEFATEEIFDQMVRRRPKIRSHQPLLNRIVEGLLVGNTLRSGEMHRWMYDRVSLGYLLEDAGLEAITACTHVTSQIDGWPAFLLDADARGAPCAHNTPRSLYLEANRPLEERSAKPLRRSAEIRNRAA
jgi:hypothetical protein